MHDWIVSEIRLSTDAKKFGEDRVQYPYHVTGMNTCGREPEQFSWRLPQRFWDNPRYDISSVAIDERTVR